MNYVSILVGKIEVMFAIIILGCFLMKKNFITNGFVKDASKLLASVISPVICVNSFITEYTADKAKALALSSLLTIVILLFSAIITKIFLGKKSLSLERFAAIFPNCGFIGIPLVSATFGQEAVFYIAPTIAICTMVCWTYGVYVLTGDKKSISLKGIITNPCVIAVLIGLIIFFCKIPVASFFTDCFSSLNGIMLPISSMIVGCNLAELNIKDIKANKSVVISALFRLLVIPVIACVLFKFVDESYYLLKYGILVSMSTPAAANSTIFAVTFGKDSQKGALAICLTSLLCVLTIPLVLTLSSLIW